MLDQGGLHVMGIDRLAGAPGRLRLHHGSAGQDESQELRRPAGARRSR